MSFFAQTPEEQKQNDQNLARTREEIQGKVEDNISRSESDSALNKTNYEGSDNGTDGFKIAKSSDTLAENGMQVLVPKDDTSEVSQYTGDEVGDAPPKESLSDDFNPASEDDEKESLVKRR